MIKPSALVVSLYDVDRDDTAQVGGKAANLGEMLSAGFPVPPGFVVTSKAYFGFLKHNKLEQKIQHLLGTINFEHEESLDQVTKNIRKQIVFGEIPEYLVNAIFDHYEKLGSDTYVAIRSSATSEDSKEASFAGQNETFLDVTGEANLAEKIKSAWASLFTSRSVFYRHEKKISHAKIGIALVVQKMVASDVSGVMFSADPVTSDKTKVVIEAIYGLGEYIVQGRVTPDHYEVNKKSLEIIKKDKVLQSRMLKKVSGADRDVKVPFSQTNRQKIADHEIISLAKLAIKLEKHYYFPQDIEWAKENNKMYLVQTRPITTLGTQSGSEKQNYVQLSKLHKAILLGSPASPGIGVGPVQKATSPSDISKVKSGDVLVATRTDPDYVPAMKRASAIITEEGGRTSHAAIVAREFGIPAVVGTPRALSVLSNGQVVTVNGKSGEIYKGGFLAKGTTAVEHYSYIKTATKLLVNLAEPEIAQRVASQNVDGVGLLRAEFMMAQIGVHPKKMIHDGVSAKFIQKLEDGLSQICKAFYPRPVLYRASDFKTNEYRNLTGGKSFEVNEANPMLGYRGAARYIRDPGVFKLELDAIKRVREKKGFNNLNLMIPYVRTVKELENVKRIVTSYGLRRSATFKLYMMVEIPSNVILIDKFIEVGIDGVSIGSNDLTMLVLGTDRDNSEVASEFDERDEAVLWSIERVIKACRKNKVTSSICGQAPSVYPSLVESLVGFGIDSISVSPDAIDQTRKTIYHAEEKIVKGRNI